MSTTTTNYNLVKPALTDAPPDITVMNPNWDTIDAQLKNLADKPSVTVDSALSSTSTNPVQNKVINSALAGKADSTHKHSAGDITSGTLPVARGGTGITSNPSMLVNLASTTADTVLEASPRPGVTGTLPIANGGTGATTAAAARTALGITPANIGAAASSHSHDYLPLAGGVLSGALTAIDNFNVNKTFDSVEYKTYVRPINYSIGNNGDYSTGLIHYKGEANQAQLMFNKDGVMLRDNVNAKAYQLFGQHNTDAVKTVIESVGVAKVAVGSYKGAELYGASNPCSLTFDFAPKLLWIYATENWSHHALEIKAGGMIPLSNVTTSFTNTNKQPYYTDTGSDKTYIKKSADGKTITWYSTSGTEQQYNDSNNWYHYIAIG